MKKSKPLFFAFWTFVLVAAGTCFAQKAPAEPEPEKFLGALKGGVYRNDYFGFSLDTPASFYDLTPGEMVAAKDGGAKLLSDGVKGDRAAWEKAAKTEIFLMMVAEKGPGSLANSSLGIGAMRQARGVSARMVANASRDFLLKSPGLQLVKDTAQSMQAGKIFAGFELEGNFNGQRMFTKYRVTIHKGHSLTFVITYIEPASLEKFEKVFSTLRFDSK
jgi:hypothetical protein